MNIEGSHVLRMILLTSQLLCWVAMSSALILFEDLAISTCVLAA